MIKYGILPILAAALLAGCGGRADETAPPPPRGMVMEKIAPITGSGGCGVPDAYLLTEAAGVRLSPSATISRDLAMALDTWLRQEAIPAVGNRGGGLARIEVAAHYACRSRNNQKGAKLSEHGKGRAIDISAFVMRDGSRLTVLDGWPRNDERPLLQKLRTSACGIFGTVLGPGSDGYHRDHFHFDVAAYRSGAYCR